MRTFFYLGVAGEDGALTEFFSKLLELSETSRAAHIRAADHYRQG